jgi:hypothetical protein
MAEDMNMLAITIDRFVNEIKYDLESECYDPMIGLGKSGVGKTMSISELCQELGIGFCELRLVTMTETDMLGIPKEDENGMTTYASNALLPTVKRDGERGILVLDEITSCSPTLRAAAYQLLDSKRALGNYKLPPKWKVIALGNGIDDGGVFSGMEHAFLSRCTCYRIEPNFKVWRKWAVKHDVNATVLGYLTQTPTALHVMDPNEMACVFPCPRSWTALSQKLNMREARLEKANGKKTLLSDEAIELYASGHIGNAEAAKFRGFYKYNSQLISPESIMDGTANPADAANLSTEVRYLIESNLVKNCSELLSSSIYEDENGRKQFKEECWTKIRNMCVWSIEASKKGAGIDYAMTIFRDLSDSCGEFLNLIQHEQFDDRIPEYTDFSVENECATGII